MIVTKIEPVTKIKFKIYVDETFAFVLYKGELLRFRIAEGQEISEEVFQKIKKEVVLKRAKLRALHLLNECDRTEAQLRTKLTQGLYTEDVVEAAMDYVRMFGYIGDADYAKRFISSRQGSKSKKEIYALLLNKGIDREEIALAMEECYEVDSELEAVCTLLRKKRFEPETADDKEKQRIYGYLARKGFGYEIIRRAMQSFGD